MREIKFRAWDTVNKRILQNVSTGTVTIWGNKGESAEAKDCIFMQYTGLKDRNGKEIYENDIIQFIDIPARFNIVWDDEDACWNAEHIGGNSTRQALRKSGAKYKEVVGNIYETN